MRRLLNSESHQGEMLREFTLVVEPREFGDTRSSVKCEDDHVLLHSTDELQFRQAAEFRESNRRWVGMARPKFCTSPC